MTSEERYVRYSCCNYYQRLDTEMDMELYLDLASLAEDSGDRPLARVNTQTADEIWRAIYGGEPMEL